MKRTVRVYWCHSGARTVHASSHMGETTYMLLTSSTQHHIIIKRAVLPLHNYKSHGAKSPSSRVHILKYIIHKYPSISCP